ncbi:unnamed protein product, partial [Ixodes hexagonus]
VTRVNCIISLYAEDGENPRGKVILQADAGGSPEGPSHLTLGAPCAINRAPCVTEDTDCDHTRNHPVCTCRKGYRFAPEVRFSRVCSDGYYIGAGGCVPSRRSMWISGSVASVAKIVLSTCYSVALFLLGVWLYKHSHSPSLVYERSVTTWEFLPKMDQ